MGAVWHKRCVEWKVSSILGPEHLSESLVLLLLPSPSRAQEDSLPSGTCAKGGLVVGGAVPVFLPFL